MSGAGLTMKTSSHPEETRPRSRLPQVGDDGESGGIAAFEASSLLSEAGTEMLEGASQEDLSRPRSHDDAAQDHSAVASSCDVSQALEVGSIPQTENADSESRDSDVGTGSGVSLTGTERLEEATAEWERAVDSYKIFVQDQQLRTQIFARENQDLARANQDLEERIRVLEAQGHKLRCGLEDMVSKSKELHKKDKMNQNAQKREFASLARIGEEALEELDADN